jgi:serine/threonine protein kinase/tetratricopeptide (TPR) repeat protein
MSKTSLFDLGPERLNKLLSIGREKLDESDDSKNKPSEPTSGEQSPAEKPGSWIGRYKLIRILGEGGMGEVYLAQQEHPIKRQVALKIIKPGMDSKRVITRFEAERQALALLDHPNIAHVYDAGTTKAGRPYFVMEYVKGLSITEHCDHHKLTIEQRLRLFQQVCQAVQHAHQKGIIHRDIKPSNILISMENDRSIPKIIDFGVAKALAQPLTERTLATEDSQLLGTPEYMSPEQADMATEDIDTRTDIYSLGVLLYVLLTGMLPFDSTTFREGGIENIRKTIRETDPKTPSTRLNKLGEEAKKVAENRRTEIGTLAKHLRKELEWIPLKAMRKERSERYRSASELADDIENYLNGKPLIAGPPGTVYKLKKFVRRNRVLVGGISTVLVVLVAGVIVSTVFAIRADQKADLSNRVLSFLTNEVLMSADPARAKRWEITLSEVLDGASENLKAKFSDEPLVEASIRHTLGSTYLSLGKCTEAEPHVESAYRIRRAALGQEHPDTLASTTSLCDLRVRQGRYEEAEQLCTTVVESRRRSLGREHPDTLASMYDLGVVYWYQRRHTEAETLFSEVWEMRRRTLGEDHPDTLSALNGLGWSYIRQARHAEAERLFERLFNICLEKLGEEHYFTQGIMNGIVQVYPDVNRYEEAELVGRRCLELRRRILGDEHPETLEAMGLLGRVYSKQGRYDEAEPLYRGILEAQRRLGIQNEKVLRQLVGLADLYVEQARYGEAEPLLQQQFQSRVEQFGPQHPHTLESLNNLITLYEAWNKPEEAEEWRTKLPETEAVTE